jgi:hypothetical protein
MADAQLAVQDAALKLPAPLIERMLGQNKLNDEDRKAVTASAAEALKRFLPKPEAALRAEVVPEAKPPP